MKAYVYEYVSRITHGYHDGGGAVVVTDRDPKVALAEAVAPLVPEFGDDSAPVVYETDATEERVFIFPDSGCC